MDEEKRLASSPGNRHRQRGGEPVPVRGSAQGLIGRRGTTSLATLTKISFSKNCFA